MDKKDIAQLKASAAAVVAKVQALHIKRAEIDTRVSEAYKEGRSKGIVRGAIKEVIRELHGNPGNAEIIWRMYIGKAGRAAMVAPAHDSLADILDNEAERDPLAKMFDREAKDPLDDILGPQLGGAE